MAEIIREGGLFHLRNAHISYVMCRMPGDVLAHLYAGPRLERVNAANLLCHAGVAADGSFSVQECALDKLPREYPSFGLGDYREGALAARAADGTTAVDLRLVDAQVLDEKPALEGLPATFGECAALRLTLRDAHTGLTAQLDYAIFDDCPALVRSARLVNEGHAPLTLTRAYSLCLELPDDSWELITLSGGWARERGVYRRPLAPGEQGVASRAGASSLQTSPFMALVRPHTTEETGPAIGLSLVYSGNFAATVAATQYGAARALIGINDRDFTWQLLPGEAFQVPEAALVISAEGIGGMSRGFHRLWQNHLLPQRWVGRHRPVLLNSWEAAYFDFDEEKLVSIAGAAAEAGAALFVMDDGWFGHRDDDTTSLGDWALVDRRKLPGGLQRLGERVRALGVGFGIWMEPEMVSPDSALYRAHPDWCLRIPGREDITSRHQLVLDLGRPDVQDFVVDAVSRTLRDSGAAYLKWDMNRNFTNIGSAILPPERQGEVAHRYILGLYAVLEKLTRDFPDVLFEGCASGGGRFDAGMLYYVPQFWCSDDTDALWRCRIQYGTTLAFPASTMGCHVSAVPNHQTGRVTPLETRFAVALGGCFGYELDPRALTDGERAALRGQVAFAEATQRLRLYGDLYRLLSPFEGNETAWMSVSGDKAEALFIAVRDRAQVNAMPPLIRLKGLDAARRYRVEETGEEFGGDELMAIGLCCPFGRGDAASLVYRLKAVD